MLSACKRIVPREGVYDPNSSKDLNWLIDQSKIDGTTHIIISNVVGRHTRPLETRTEPSSKVRHNDGNPLVKTAHENGSATTSKCGGCWAIGTWLAGLTSSLDCLTPM